MFYWSVLHVFRLLKEDVNYIYVHDGRSVKCFKWLKYELMKYNQIRKELSLLQYKINNIFII